MRAIPLSLLAALLAVGAALPVHAQAPQTAPAAGNGLREIPDAELGDMRGRYIVGDNRIAWFGVSMVSTWLTGSGQAVQGAMKMGFDVRGNTPVVSFTPSVTITEGAPALAATGDRAIDSAGLANVDGLVQSIQVAGDANAARNGTTLTIRDGDAPSASAQDIAPATAFAQSGGVTAQAGVDNGAARVLLQIAGQGATEQWIGANAVGQSIRIAGDGQSVSNQLQLDLVRQALPSGQSIQQSVAQAIVMSRGIGL
ncbi:MULTISPECIES: hypothetical protein [Luteimonas]|uniref:hypothetical protein n=1 Tax=Luteimonas TaxID=83614 RepID=UPI000C7E2335|nr:MULTISPECIES: hypothetical protein [Luteimonas]